MSPEPSPTPPAASASTAIPDLLLTAVSLLFICSPFKSLRSIPHFSTLSFPLNPTFFLRIPLMSRRSSPPRLHRFASPQSLSDWLRPRVPSDSFATWGVKPGTKNVNNLWVELSEGETSLADSIPPVRTVNVVTVRILGKGGLVLVESHQELSDGSVRRRGRPLSEKMKPDESPEEAAVRAVKEELGSIVSGDGENISETVRIVPGSYSSKVEERNSVSYPGLPARYVLHSVEAVVDGLPGEEFCTEEDEHGGDSDFEGGRAITVKRHHWKWVNPDLLES